MEQQLKQQLRELRLDTEKWFSEMDKEAEIKKQREAQIEKIIEKQRYSDCFICNESMDTKEAHLINLDGEVTALICWKCFERNIDNSILESERGNEY